MTHQPTLPLLASDAPYSRIAPLDATILDDIDEIEQDRAEVAACLARITARRKRVRISHPALCDNWTALELDIAGLLVGLENDVATLEGSAA